MRRAAVFGLLVISLVTTNAYGVGGSIALGSLGGGISTGLEGGTQSPGLGLSTHRGLEGDSSNNGAFGLDGGGGGDGEVLNGVSDFGLNGGVTSSSSSSSSSHSNSYGSSSSDVSSDASTTSDGGSFDIEGYIKDFASNFRDSASFDVNSFKAADKAANPEYSISTTTGPAQTNTDPVSSTGVENAGLASTLISGITGGGDGEVLNGVSNSGLNGGVSASSSSSSSSHSNSYGISSSDVSSDASTTSDGGSFDIEGYIKDFASNFRDSGSFDVNSFADKVANPEYSISTTTDVENAGLASTLISGITGGGGGGEVLNGVSNSGLNGGVSASSSSSSSSHSNSYGISSSDVSSDASTTSDGGSFDIEGYIKDFVSNFRNSASFDVNSFKAADKAANPEYSLSTTTGPAQTNTDPVSSTGIENAGLASTLISGNADAVKSRSLNFGGQKGSAVVGVSAVGADSNAGNAAASAGIQSGNTAIVVGLDSGLSSGLLDSQDSIAANTDAITSRNFEIGGSGLSSPTLSSAGATMGTQLFSGELASLLSSNGPPPGGSVNANAAVPGHESGLFGTPSAINIGGSASDVSNSTSGISALQGIQLIGGLADLINSAGLGADSNTSASSGGNIELGIGDGLSQFGVQSGINNVNKGASGQTSLGLGNFGADISGLSSLANNESSAGNINQLLGLLSLFGSAGPGVGSSSEKTGSSPNGGIGIGAGLGQFSGQTGLNSGSNNGLNGGLISSQTSLDGSSSAGALGNLGGDISGLSSLANNESSAGNINQLLGLLSLFSSAGLGAGSSTENTGASSNGGIGIGAGLGQFGGQAGLNIGSSSSGVNSGLISGQTPLDGSSSAGTLGNLGGDISGLSSLANNETSAGNINQLLGLISFLGAAGLGAGSSTENMGASPNGGIGFGAGLGQLGGQTELNGGSSNGLNGGLISGQTNFDGSSNAGGISGLSSLANNQSSGIDINPLVGLLSLFGSAGLGAGASTENTGAATNGGIGIGAGLGQFGGQTELNGGSSDGLNGGLISGQTNFDGSSNAGGISGLSSLANNQSSGIDINPLLGLLSLFGSAGLGAGSSTENMGASANGGIGIGAGLGQFGGQTGLNADSSNGLNSGLISGQTTSDGPSSAEALGNFGGDISGLSSLANNESSTGNINQLLGLLSLFGSAGLGTGSSNESTGASPNGGIGIGAGLGQVGAETGLKDSSNKGNGEVLISGQTSLGESSNSGTVGNFGGDISVSSSPTEGFSSVSTNTQLIRGIFSGLPDTVVLDSGVGSSLENTGASAQGGVGIGIGSDLGLLDTQNGLNDGRNKGNGEGMTSGEISLGGSAIGGAFGGDISGSSSSTQSPASATTSSQLIGGSFSGLQGSVGLSGDIVAGSTSENTGVSAQGGVGIELNDGSNRVNGNGLTSGQISLGGSSIVGAFGGDISGSSSPAQSSPSVTMNTQLIGGSFNGLSGGIGVASSTENTGASAQGGIGIGLNDGGNRGNGDGLTSGQISLGGSTIGGVGVDIGLNDGSNRGNGDGLTSGQISLGGSSIGGAFGGDISGSSSPSQSSSSFTMNTQLIRGSFNGLSGGIGAASSTEKTGASAPGGIGIGLNDGGNRGNGDGLTSLGGSSIGGVDVGIGLNDGSNRGNGDGLTSGQISLGGSSIGGALGGDISGSSSPTQSSSSVTMNTQLIGGSFNGLSGGIGVGSSTENTGASSQGGIGIAVGDNLGQFSVQTGLNDGSNRGNGEGVTSGQISLGRSSGVGALGNFGGDISGSSSPTQSSSTTRLNTQLIGGSFSGVQGSVGLDAGMVTTGALSEGSIGIGIGHASGDLGVNTGTNDESSRGHDESLITGQSSLGGSLSAGALGDTACSTTSQKLFIGGSFDGLKNAADVSGDIGAGSRAINTGASSADVSVILTGNTGIDIGHDSGHVAAHTGLNDDSDKDNGVDLTAKSFPTSTTNTHSVSDIIGSLKGSAGINGAIGDSLNTGILSGNAGMGIYHGSDHAAGQSGSNDNSYNGSNTGVKSEQGSFDGSAVGGASGTLHSDVLVSSHPLHSSSVPTTTLHLIGHRHGDSNGASGSGGGIATTLSAINAGAVGVNGILSGNFGSGADATAHSSTINTHSRGESYGGSKGSAGMKGVSGVLGGHSVNSGFEFGPGIGLEDFGANFGIKGGSNGGYVGDGGYGGNGGDGRYSGNGGYSGNGEFGGNGGHGGGGGYGGNGGYGGSGGKTGYGEHVRYVGHKKHSGYGDHGHYGHDGHFHGYTNDKFRNHHDHRHSQDDAHDHDKFSSYEHGKGHRHVYNDGHKENHGKSHSHDQVHIKTVDKGHGDLGYLLGK